MAYAPTSKLNYLKAVSIYLLADQLEELKQSVIVGVNQFLFYVLNEQGEVIKEGNKSKSVEMTLYLSVCRYHYKESAVSFNLIFQFYTRRTILC